jgi:DNA-binding NtrC family response regulator
MTRKTVALVGSLPFEMASLNRLAQEMGWGTEVVSDFDELRVLSALRKPVAILLDAAGLGVAWEEALEEARKIDSEALLIACHRFSERVNWPELAEAGAFHALALPLDPGEVRQSLGFVWSAWFRRGADVIRMHRAVA